MSKPNVYKPNLIQVRLRYTNEPDGDHTENVLWFSGVSGGASLTAGQLSNIAAVVDANAPGVWKNAAPTNTRYLGSIVTDWQSNLGLSVDTTLTFGGVAGTLGGMASPANVAALVSNAIPLRYRGGHGRMYLPYVAQGALTDPNTLSGTVINNIASGLSGFSTAMAAITGANFGPWNQAVYKFRNDPVKAAVYLITTQTVRGTVASQRRRLRKAPHH